MREVDDTELVNKLDFVDSKERVLFAKAQLGEQAREFLATPVGRYLHGRAQQDMDDVKDQLLGTNVDSFFGRRKFRRLQSKAECARMFMAYLVDAITEGEHAAVEFEQYRTRG